MIDSIYIHIPFCNRKCSYCDFYILTNMPKAYQKYVDYLKKEIEMYEKRYYDTIYFGGGTPSVLEVRQIKSILDSLYFDKNTEVTLELNPTNMDLEKLKELKKIGVNRLSIGIQSFNDKILKLMNREHNSDDGIKTYYDARNAGFDNISLDLIFAVPTQSLKDLEYDLKKIIELTPDHISIYSLIWEKGSMFSKLLRENKIKKLDEEIEIKMYEYVIDTLKKNGYKHYEISSFCKDNKYGRHNMKYWGNKEFIGVGISASSYYDSYRFEKIRNLRSYYAFIDEGKIPINEKTKVLVDEKELKDLKYILGLRMLEIGVEYEEEKKEIYDKLIKKELLEIKNNRVFVTKKGLFLFDNISLEFM